jgi:hypothetical protein
MTRPNANAEMYGPTKDRTAVYEAKLPLTIAKGDGNNSRRMYSAVALRCFRQSDRSSRLMRRLCIRELLPFEDSRPVWAHLPIYLPYFNLSRYEALATVDGLAAPRPVAKPSQVHAARGSVRPQREVVLSR